MPAGWFCGMASDASGMRWSAASWMGAGAGVGGGGIGVGVGVGEGAVGKAAVGAGGGVGGGAAAATALGVGIGDETGEGVAVGIAAGASSSASTTGCATEMGAGAATNSGIAGMLGDSATGATAGAGAATRAALAKFAARRRSIFSRSASFPAQARARNAARSAGSGMPAAMDWMLSSDNVTPVLCAESAAGGFCEKGFRNGFVGLFMPHSVRPSGGKRRDIFRSRLRSAAAPSRFFDKRQTAP